MTTSASNSTAVSNNDIPSMAPATVWTPPDRAQARKRRRTMRLGIAAVAVAAYAAGAVYFSNHFTPNTTVDGVDAGLMTTAELAEAIEQRADGYEQHITADDGFDTTIAGRNISLACDGTQVADEALSRTTPILWLPYCLTPQHMLITTQISVNEEALASELEAAVASYNEQAEQPTNATGTFDEEADAFVPTHESVGTQLDADKVVKASLAGIYNLDEAVHVGTDALTQPSVTDQDEKLLSSIEQANKIVNNGDIEVICGDETIATIDRKTMIPWFSFDEEQNFAISGVADWVRGNEAIQDAGNARDDEHVWELDLQGTIDDIHRVMEQDLGDKAEVKRIVIESKPAATPGAKERGRHIDINLSTQFVRFYDSDGKVIWDSYCVTGGWDPEKGSMHYTPVGEYAIQAKETGRTLIGVDSDLDGQPDYESFVNYWMPFLNYDYGLHDATWRYEFGGDIYTWWGSHGCVNLPYDKAEELFNLVQVGDPVIVHE